MNAYSLSPEDKIVKAKNGSKFRDLAIEISELAKSAMITIVPFNEHELIYFSTLEITKQIKILNSLEIFLNVYKAVQAEGSSLLDSVRVIWNALVQLGYRPPSDLFSFIKTGDVIEIHSHEFVQLFRNLNFFNYCSYSLEELYCVPVQELYSRDQQAMQNIINIAIPIFSGKVKDVVTIKFDPHIISESMSKARLKIKDQIKFMAPLFSTVDPSVAIISIETAEIVDDTIDIGLPDTSVADELVIENLVQLKPHFSAKPSSLS